jgi:solute carrier family 36 (proton-coupled amino acid transporter)
MAPGEGRPDFAMSSLDVGEEAVGEEEEGESSMRVREILEPGGFRRDFVNRKRSDTDLPSVPGREFGAEGGGGARSGNGGRATRSFIDFLSLYGHFGGEDLEEIEEEDEEEEDEEDQVEGLDIPPFQREVSERTPLVRGRSHGRGGAQVGRKRSSSVGEHGDATVTQAVFMLLKSFVGTGVLFLGKA